jgi:hypothetical protein
MKGQKGAKPASAGKTTLRFLCAAVAAVVLLCAAIILFDGAKPPEAEPHAEWISPRPDAALAETGMRPRTTSPAESEVLIRPRLSSALGFGVERPPASRILELMDTRESLSRGEVEELLRALLSHDNGQLANRSTWFHEIANLVQSQDHDRRAFAEVLATVARDDKRSHATRDYALQQLRRVWAGSGSDKSLRRAIEETFIEMNVEDNPLRSTALLSLHLLEGVDTESRASRSLRQSVISILGDSGLTGANIVPDRMVAARIAGERQILSLRRDLLMIASSDQQHALVRMSAASALGNMGSSSELDSLSSLNPADQRVAAAVRHATQYRSGR